MLGQLFFTRKYLDWTTRARPLYRSVNLPRTYLQHGLTAWLVCMQIDIHVRPLLIRDLVVDMDLVQHVRLPWLSVWVVWICLKDDILAIGSLRRTSVLYTFLAVGSACMWVGGACYIIWLFSPILKVVALKASASIDIKTTETLSFLRFLLLPIQFLSISRRDVSLLKCFFLGCFLQLSCKPKSRLHHLWRGCLIDDCFLEFHQIARID